MAVPIIPVLVEVGDLRISEGHIRCLSRGFYCDKTQQLERVISLRWGKSGQELRARGPGGWLLAGLLRLFSYHPGTPALVASLPVGWVLSYQSLIKKSTAELPTGQFGGGLFSQSRLLFPGDLNLHQGDTKPASQHSL